MNDIVVQSKEERGLTVAQVKTSINLIQQVMQETMKKDAHYGTIPGCGSKPTLFKAGAEKIMAAFHLVCSPVVDDLSALPDLIRYQVRAEIRAADGRLVGVGIGECSSDEEKYRWRKAIGGEWEDTPEDRRREKWKNGKRGAYKESQVRTNPADLANTILKMAKKRALIDGVLTATAASDCFTQDIEELPDEYIGVVSSNDDNPTPAPRETEDPRVAIWQHKEVRDFHGTEGLHEQLGAHGFNESTMRPLAVESDLNPDKYIEAVGAWLKEKEDAAGREAALDFINEGNSEND
jgi:hypothetical protein